MPSVITMPAFSSTMESGKLVQWLVNEGDKVKSGQPIAEIETDKAIAEIEATTDGYLARILIPDSDAQISVNSAIGVILSEGESEDTLSEYSAKAKVAEPAVVKDAKVINKGEADSSSEKQVQTSPGARRVANEAGIDVSLVKGTGPKGRITKTDVLDYIASNPEQSKSENSVAPVADNSTISQTCTQESIAISPMRNAIAKRLVESKRDIPHFYLEINIELDKLLELKSSLSEHGTLPKLSLNVFFIKAAALAMKDVPEINSTWIDDHIVQNGSCNIGIAVAIDDGLIVPVIADVDKSDLTQLQQESTKVIDLARAGKLPQSRMGNASLSISNLGMYGIEKFSAIINPPESCILALGTTTKRPVVVEDSVVIRSVMTCSMSADHRLIDGAIAAQFLNKFKTLLEKPISMLM
jgi:pyruvate dehydrogenase E2 component (dihydrolipoyllysine-residue acetyltransferase)